MKIITNEAEYERALEIYQELKDAPALTEEHKQKMFIAICIADYEEKTCTLPEVTDEEFKAIYERDFKNGIS